MPTIKRKVEMNLPQLIEWIIENDTTYEQYEPMLVKGLRFVAVDGYGDIRIHGFVRQDDTFTVEIEEEITEDTVIPKILVKTNYDHTAREYCNSKINQFLSQYYKAFYIVNDDETMDLIWKNGKLVE
ncbi:hypothetical protein [Mammaliicoccus lentus]|uniref:hypothetical protein n=1 Tax=Mammaliicoccus lentus TaxID=42858 RepID=UPI001071DF67|nr:hypothetical protein [Mammaliicoccus lentus]MBF0793783.1 hypothetical protein [Mammaliicoccus lentus]TFV17084.1 hypothetical protein E4T78_03885 [Mammaliicoccus lentus]